MTINKQLYINFEDNIYHIHQEFENTNKPFQYLCGAEVKEDISLRAVERKYLRSQGINSRENPLCRNCYNTLLD